MNMKRFQLYKVVTRNRFLHIKSVEANSRKEAIAMFKTENKKMIFGFKFWQYYVTGLAQPFPSHIMSVFFSTEP